MMYDDLYNAGMDSRANKSAPLRDRSVPSARQVVKEYLDSLVQEYQHKVGPIYEMKLAEVKDKEFVWKIDDSIFCVVTSEWDTYICVTYPCCFSALASERRHVFKVLIVRLMDAARSKGIDKVQVRGHVSLQSSRTFLEKNGFTKLENGSRVKFPAHDEEMSKREKDSLLWDAHYGSPITWERKAREPRVYFDKRST